MTATALPPRAPAPPPPLRWPWLFLLPAVVFPALLLAWAFGVVAWPPAVLLPLVLALPVLALPLRRLRLSRSLIFYELLRAARRDRNLVFRCLYVSLLLGVLCWFYVSWFAGRGEPLWAVLLDEQGVELAQMSRFAGQFFATFLAAQMAAVLLVTPVYTAGVIAEEKERRSLEFLLATDLSSSEIVLSKLAARLANLVLLFLAGLPVLALTQLWGGVDPLLLLDGFLATGALLLSVASLSALNSVYARSSLQALLRTYAVLAVFLTVGTCIPGINFAHPGVLLWMVSEIGESGGPETALLAFMGYASIHLLATFICTRSAVTRLRAAALNSPAPSAPEPAGVPSAMDPPRWRPPPVGDNPLVWKELYAEGRFCWDQVPALLQALLLFCGISAAVSGIMVFFAVLNRPQVLEPMNTWVRACGTPVACALVFLTAVHAARAVSRERERQTLDSLRSLPEDDAAILGAKWLGSVASTRHGWWCLGAIWAWGTVTGGLVPLAVPLLALACGVYAGFAAALGLYCSTICRTTLRATLATVLVLLAVGGGPWVLWDLGELVLPRGAVGPWLVLFQHDGLTPPMPLWVLAFGYEEVVTPSVTAWASRVLAALAGLACYAAAGWLLWRRALARFRAEA